MRRPPIFLAVILAISYYVYLWVQQNPGSLGVGVVAVFALGIVISRVMDSNQIAGAGKAAAEDLVTTLLIPLIAARLSIIILRWQLHAAYETINFVSEQLRQALIVIQAQGQRIHQLEQDNRLLIGMSEVLETGPGYVVVRIRDPKHYLLEELLEIPHVGGTVRLGGGQ